jgi:hypothetical protein
MHMAVNPDICVRCRTFHSLRGSEDQFARALIILSEDDETPRNHPIAFKREIQKVMWQERI